jgi:hypothetical protein
VVGFWVVHCYFSSLVCFSLSSCPRAVVKGLIGPHSHQRPEFEGGVEEGAVELGPTIEVGC